MEEVVEKAVVPVPEEMVFPRPTTYVHMRIILLVMTVNLSALA